VSGGYKQANIMNTLNFLYLIVLCYVTSFMSSNFQTESENDLDKTEYKYKTNTK
jgi:hypothetical protein